MPRITFEGYEHYPDTKINMPVNGFIKFKGAEFDIEERKNPKLAGITMELVESIIGKEFYTPEDETVANIPPGQNLREHLLQNGFELSALEINYLRSQEITLTKQVLKAFSLSATPREARNCFIVLDVAKK